MRGLLITFGTQAAGARPQLSVSAPLSRMNRLAREQRARSTCVRGNGEPAPPLPPPLAQLASGREPARRDGVRTVQGLCRLMLELQDRSLRSLNGARLSI